MTLALSLRDLRKTYRSGVEALKGIDLEVPEGEFFALLGPNGAGKSTAIGIVSSLVRKTGGKVEVFGHDLDLEPEAVKACIGLVPQEFNFNQFEPVAEIVVNQAGYYGVPRPAAWRRAETVLRQLDLWGRRTVMARTLSGGMNKVDVADDGVIYICNQTTATGTTPFTIYAIGDLVPGPMLAHKASAEGMAAAQTIAGKFGEVNYDAIPAIVYTAPEVASVGLTEEQVKERGIPYVTGVYPFTGNGRAKCFGDTEGLVKLIAHRKTDRLLGAHIIGVRAAEMIAEAVLAVEFGASLEDLAGTVHGHPTFAEAIMEAAMAAHR